MSFTIIGQNGRSFHHLSDVVVAEIVTKVNLIDRTVGNVTARMKEIARESGCSLNTVYRIYRSSLVTMAKDYDVINGRYTIDHFEHTAQAAIRDRADKRSRSLANCHKRKRCDGFVMKCLEYMKGSRLRTIDEAVHVVGAEYRGEKCCMKTFYNWVNAGKIDELRRKDLPRAPGWKTKKKYKEYTAKDSRGKSILERPEEINAREGFGHWEGDLVVGPRDGANGAYLTLLERTTRFYLMIPIKDKKAVTVLEALRDLRDRHPYFGQVFRTITFDNGAEFSRWREMESELGITTYFGRPYHSCDRGSNENCNGLIRRFIKKGTDINKIDRKFSRQINKEINGKKRKLFGYESAEERFTNALVKHGIPYVSLY